jgi:hypothetical protein
MLSDVFESSKPLKGRWFSDDMVILAPLKIHLSAVPFEVLTFAEGSIWLSPQPGQIAEKEDERQNR